MPRKLWSQLQQDLTYSWHPLPFGCITSVDDISPGSENGKSLKDHTFFAAMKLMLDAISGGGRELSSHYIHLWEKHIAAGRKLDDSF
jgi:hypothetical protein